jgi:hypothetical protein
METLDNVNDGDTSRGFLYKIIQDLKVLDENTVKCLLEKEENLLTDVVGTLSTNKEIELRDSFIFIKRGGAKINKNLQLVDTERRRRQSFASAGFADQEVLLRLESIREMSDLNFIFSLNGYHLPYCESSRQRSMYEWFFSAFLREIHHRFPEPSIFKILQESVMTIYVVSELCVDLLECLFETLNMVRTKLREIDLNSSSDSDKPMTPRSPRRIFDDTLFEHLQRCFHDSEKVFSKFRTRKLLNSILGEKDETWLNKFDNYREALLEAVEIHKLTCEACKKSIQGFFNNSLKPEAIAFCNDIIIYIDSYTTFLDLFGSRGSGRRTIMIGRQALIQLEEERVKNKKSKESPREYQSAWNRMSDIFMLRKSPK